MSGPPMRAVFDCNVFVQAALDENGPAFACLALAESGNVESVVSPATLDEVRDVLSRPKLARRFRHLTPERVAAFVDRITRISTLIPHVNKVFTYPRDPKDEQYVDLAVTAGARLLVSRDLDLLDLMDSSAPAAVDFQQRFPQLTVVDPVAFLRVVQAMSP